MEKPDRLKILRLLSGYTQAELARMVQIPQASLAVMEKGKYGVAGNKGISVASALGVPFEYLYLGTPSVDSNDPNVWIPIPPARSQHLQSMFNDITALFPLFLTENSFNAVISSGELSDGSTVFLIGRKSNTKMKAEVNITCLLMADKRLVNCFNTAFKASKVKITSELSSNHSMDTFLIKQFGLLLDGVKFKFSVEEIRDKIAEARNRKENSVMGARSELNTDDMQTIFKVILHEIKDYRLNDIELRNLSDMIVDLCQSRGNNPSNNIDPIVVMTEARKVLLSMGCKRRVERLLPIYAEPAAEEYLLLKEWLRELWLGTDTDQQVAILKLFTKKTDFGVWLEKYRKDIKK